MAIDSSPRNPLTTDFFMEVVRGRVRGAFAVHTFGECSTIPTGSFTHVWDGNTEDVAVRIPDPTWQTSATLDSIVVTDNSDTGQLILIEGLDESKDLVLQEVRTTGQTPALLQVPLLRVNGAKNISLAGGNILGNLYIYGSASSVTLGVPDDPTLVGGIIRDSHNRTQMAMFTVPRGHSLYATHGWGTVSKSGGATAVAIEMRINTRYMDNVWYELHRTELLSHGGSQNNRPYTLPILIPAENDLTYVVRPSTSGLSASTGFHAVILREDYVNSRPPRYIDEFGTVTYLYEN